MRISDWSSDVCSSDLRWRFRLARRRIGRRLLDIRGCDRGGQDQDGGKEDIAVHTVLSCDCEVTRMDRKGPPRSPPKAKTTLEHLRSLSVFDSSLRTVVLCLSRFARGTTRADFCAFPLPHSYS